MINGAGDFFGASLTVGWGGCGGDQSKRSISLAYRLKVTLLLGLRSVDSKQCGIAGGDGKVLRTQPLNFCNV